MLDDIGLFSTTRRCALVSCFSSGYQLAFLPEPFVPCTKPIFPFLNRRFNGVTDDARAVIKTFQASGSVRPVLWVIPTGAVCSIGHHDLCACVCVCVEGTRVSRSWRYTVVTLTRQDLRYWPVEVESEWGGTDGY